MAAKKKIPQLTAEQLVEVAQQQLFHTGDLSWLMYPHQEETFKMFSSPDDFAVSLCGRGFGKSFISACLAIETAIKIPNAYILIIAPTKDQAKEIYTPIFESIEKYNNAKSYHKLKSDFAYEFVNGSRIRLGGYELCNESFRGVTIKLLILDEIGSATENIEYTFNSVLLPAVRRINNKDGRIRVISTPSPVPAHYFHTTMIPLAQRKNMFIQSDVFEYMEHLTNKPEQWVDDTIALIGKTAFQREYLCQIVKDENRMIVPEFNKEIHVADNISVPQYGYFYIAGDMGGVEDYFCAHLCVYDFYINKLLILDEVFFKSGTSSQLIVDRLKISELLIPKDKQRAEVIQRWIDSPGQLQIDWRKQFQYNIMLPLKDDKIAALNNLRLLFSQNRILIDSKCVNTIMTLENGIWNPRHTDWTRTIDFGHCDCIAALQYGCRHQDKRNPEPPYSGNLEDAFREGKFKNERVLNSVRQRESMKKAFNL